MRLKKLYKMNPDGVIARRLAIAMRKNGMGVIDLHEHSGVAMAGISGYLNGRSVPTRRTAMRLAKSLNVNDRWLMGIGGSDNVVEAPTEGYNDVPAALFSIYNELTDRSKNYLRETALLLKTQEGLMAKGAENG